MPTIKVIQKNVDKLRAPSATGKQEAYWDGLHKDALKGFGVLISGVRSTKSYIVQAAIAGNTRRVTIGKTNVLDAATARQKAKEVLANLTLGVDPKAAKRGIPTLAEALQQYLDVRKDLSTSTRATYTNLVERHLKPWLEKPLTAITDDMVKARHHELGESAAAGPATANAAMRALRAIWNFIGEKKLGPHPVQLKRRWHELKDRTGHVKPEQLAAFYRAVCALPNAVHTDYVTLLLFTGLRRREAAALRWDHINFADKTMSIPAANTKTKRKLDLPLTDVLFDLLMKRRALGNAGWVFPSTGKSGYIQEPKYALRQVEATCGIKIGPHDLRRTFITVAESTDISLMALMALANHSIGKSMTARYIQMTPERLREPAQKVADKLKELCEIASVETGKVARLR
jgi:integrase